MLTSDQQKYIHISFTNVAGKWKSIALSNLSKVLSANECVEIYPAVAEQIKEVQLNILNKLIRLEAPAIILDNQKKLTEKVNRPLDKMVATDLNPLKQRIKQSKGSLSILVK